MDPLSCNAPSDEMNNLNSILNPTSDKLSLVEAIQEDICEMFILSVGAKLENPQKQGQQSHSSMNKRTLDEICKVLTDHHDY